MVSKAAITSLLLTLVANTTAAATVDAGFDVDKVASVMQDRASHSWEWGTAAQALLELYNNELSIYGSNPFPGGQIPKADPKIKSLSYVKGHINTQSDTLVGADGAAGDPASLGVSAILIGTSDKRFSDAADRQANHLLTKVPRYSNGAISHRESHAELWADNMSMSFPFLAYQAVAKNDTGLMATTVKQCGLQRDVLKTNQYLNWRHIIGDNPNSQDQGLWSTGNGWAGYGMVRVLHTLQAWPRTRGMTTEINNLKTWIKEILDGAMLSGFDDGLLHNYLNKDDWFGEVSGTALLTAVAYRMAVNDAAKFPQKYIDWADTNRKNLARHVRSDGVASPAVNPLGWTDRNKFTTGSPEGQAFMVFLYTSYRDCVNKGVCKQ